MSEQRDIYFQVLAKIQEFNAKNVSSSFSEIVKAFPNEPRVNIHRAIDVLSDWAIIHGQYTISNHVCRYNYFIDELAPIEYQPSSFANESTTKEHIHDQK